MKRIWSHAVSLLGLALATSAVVPACVENNESIFIRNVVAPSANKVNGICIYQPDPNGAGLFEGTLDVGVRDDYYAVLLVGGHLIQRGDPLSARAESNRTQLSGATSRITNPDGSTVREFTSFGTGFVETAASGTPGFGVFGAPIVDAPTRDILAASLPNRTATRTIIANVKVFGKTLGGVDVETGEYQFPIKVCNGCLVDFTTGNDPAVQPNPNCAKAGTDTTGGGAATQNVPCNPGQDEITPCELCVGRPACNGG
jgi:hypothetical protein